MGVFGPYTAVAGTVQQCPVDPDAQAVYISNTTIYDLYIAASPIAPPASSAFGGWPWIRCIPQGDRAGLRLPLERYAGAGFPGYIWVLPLTAALLTNSAATGTISGNNQFSIEGYSSPDEMPTSYGSPQFQNSASQPRVVTVPYATAHWLAGSAGMTSGAVVNVTTMTPTAAQLAASRMPIYFYWALFTALTPGTSGQLGSDFTLGIQWQTAGSVNVGSLFPFTRQAAYAALNTTNNAVYASCIPIMPPEPLVYAGGGVGNIPATATKAVLQLVTNGVLGTGVTVAYAIACWTDVSNLVPNADPGATPFWGTVQGNPLF